jgi:hypothetical protein
MKMITVGASLLAVFIITACDISVDTSPSRSFDFDLQGTWVSNDPGVYDGKLVITHDRITVTGYGENQTPSPGGDDNKRPFKDITKGIALKGYSEQGKIFIEDGGLLLEGIAYTYWEESPPPAYTKLKFLGFTFGGRVEKLQCQ